MKLFFAGTETLNFGKLLKTHNVENILQSAYYLEYRKKPNELNFKNALLDSGGFTAIVKNMPIDLKQYIDFINKNDVKLAITLDVPDFNQTVENTYILKQHTNAKILPVYHDSDFIDKAKRNIVEKYIADFDYICIAGLNRKLLKLEEKMMMGNYVFSLTRNKIKVHGLAITNQKYNEAFPFYSIDSTTWLNPSMYGTTKNISNVALLKYRNKNRHYLERISDDISYWLNFEKQITDLWRKRGVNWD